MRFLVLFVGVFVWLAAPGDAHAYLDPGTGSAVIQMVVAGVMGALFMMKLYWRKLVAYFGGETVDDDESAANEPAASDEADRR
jgi:hypothetical protein